MGEISELNRRDKARITELEQRYFRGHALKYRPRLESQSLDREGTVLVGDRAGPSRNAQNLLHEMCHFVEIEPERCYVHGWGLKLPEVWTYDRMCCEPRTIQITMRELRVCAYQWAVTEHLWPGSFGIYYTIRSLRYLPDNHLIKVPGKKRNKWLLETCRELRKEFTVERFEYEWWKRNKPEEIK